MSHPQSPPFQRDDLFGGQGTVKIWSLLGAAAAPPFTAVLSCELAPSGAVGRHHQERFPEIIIGLGGEGLAEVNGVEHALAPGALVYLPLGAVLSLRNLSGTEWLRYLIVKAQG